MHTRTHRGQTVITADELMETSDVSVVVSVLNQVSAASVVQQNAATLFYCEAPELFCGLPHFTDSSTGLPAFSNTGTYELIFV